MSLKLAPGANELTPVYENSAMCSYGCVIYTGASIAPVLTLVSFFYWADY